MDIAELDLLTLENTAWGRLKRTSVNRTDLAALCLPLRADDPGGAALEFHGPPPEQVIVTGLCGDSRQVRPGDLFIASPGGRDDGQAHIGEALAAGAAAVVGARGFLPPAGSAYVGVPDPVGARGLLAGAFFGHPSRRLKLVGITGTNGKTTSAHMLASMLTMDGRRTGILGTLGAVFAGRHEPLGHTTPDAIEVQRLLARMVDENVSTVVMETSSHGLAQRRVAGLDFAVGVFTNLSRDHLDYHGSMERYADAKARLFEGLAPDATAVLNGADPVSEVFASRTQARVVRYALEPAVDALAGDIAGAMPDAELRARITRLDADGVALRLRAPGLGADFGASMRLVGRHNVNNMLAAAGAALALGVPAATLRSAIESLGAVPGRLEPVDCGQDFRVLVDYAHTPDALEQVLGLLRPLTRGRLIVVFGCGGDRDRTKRPLMGAAVARSADRLVVTSDNPRSEEPGAIIEEVLAGLDGDALSRTLAEPDRRAAIARACGEARGGDIVLIAGKGHETTQTSRDGVIPFDDREVAREVLWSL